jgi:hypothetical protein
MNFNNIQSIIRDIPTYLNLNRTANRFGTAATIMFGFGVVVALCLFDKMIVSMVCKLINNLILIRMPLDFSFFTKTRLNRLLEYNTALFVLQKSELVGDSIVLTLGSILPVFLFGILMGLIYTPFDVILNYATGAKPESKDFHLTFFIDSIIRSLFLSIGKPEISSCLFLLKVIRRTLARPNTSGVFKLVLKDLALSIVVCILFLKVEGTYKTAIVYEPVMQFKTILSNLIVKRVVDGVISASEFGTDKLNLDHFSQLSKTYNYGSVVLEAVNNELTRLYEYYLRYEENLNVCRRNLSELKRTRIVDNIKIQITKRRISNAMSILETRMKYLHEVRLNCVASPNMLVLSTGELVKDKQRFLNGLSAGPEHTFKFSRHGCVNLLTTFMMWGIILNPKELTSNVFFNNLVRTALSYLISYLSVMIVDNYELFGFSVISDHEFLESFFKTMFIIQEEVLSVVGYSPLLSMLWTIRHSFWFFVNNLDQNVKNISESILLAFDKLVLLSIGKDEIRSFINFMYSTAYSLLSTIIATNPRDKLLPLAMIQSIPRCNVSLRIAGSRTTIKELLTSSAESLQSIVSLQLGAVLHKNQSELQVKCNSEEFNNILFLLGLIVMALIKMYQTSFVFYKFQTLFNLQNTCTDLNSGLVSGLKLYFAENIAYITPVIIFLLIVLYELIGIKNSSVVFGSGVTRILLLFLVKKIYGVFTSYLVNVLSVPKDSYSDALLNSFSGKKLVVTCVSSGSNTITMLKIIPAASVAYFLNLLDSL